MRGQRRQGQLGKQQSRKRRQGRGVRTDLHCACDELFGFQEGRLLMGECLPSPHEHVVRCLRFQSRDCEPQGCTRRHAGQSNTLHHELCS